MPQRERRHHRRVEAAWPVTCYRVTRTGLPGEPFAAETVDLSAGGMAIVTDEPIFRPTRVAVKLTVDDTEMVVRGVVVRVGSHNGRLMAALRFEGLDVSAQVAIARMVFREAKLRDQGRRRVEPGDARWWHGQPPQAEPGQDAAAAG